ncbi:DUF2953 domain-containing protein [Methanogenium sp. S4BF]|uniref:DUF2953 domain-containing protein n=1 Tax=Methanogenium sp. S4BF TaxID=1789226 RepID=UPI0024168046|nr:DUF2953 domain-containing protein [Methanogenium sp. S4BF]WFN34199.1 DUF2953 domain-containing protein [Methanogenium sp. S4BF]
MLYGILLIAVALLIVFVAALLIILWAVPVTFTGRAELCRDAPTMLIAFCAEWGIVALHADIPDGTAIEVSLFGRTFRRVLPETGQTEPLPKEEPEPPQKEEAKAEKGTPAPDIIGIADAILPQAGPLLHRIAIDHLCASVRIGLGDAALTGQVFGILMALRGMLMATGGRVSLAAAAEFHDHVVEGEAEGAIRIAHPLSLVPPVVRIIRHPAVWKMVKSR